jgi:acyl carrier protein
VAVESERLAVQNQVVEREVRAFLAENFLLGDVPLASSGSLIETGIIDSTGVLELVGFLEERYDIRVADDELVPENLDSIDNILRFLREKASTGASD